MVVFTRLHLVVTIFVTPSVAKSLQKEDDKTGQPYNMLIPI